MGYEGGIENVEQQNDTKDSFIKFANNLAASTYVPNVIASNGSFGRRMFRLKATNNHLNYVDPILIIGTDGIGSLLRKKI